MGMGVVGIHFLAGLVLAKIFIVPNYRIFFKYTNMYIYLYYIFKIILAWYFYDTFLTGPLFAENRNK